MPTITSTTTIITDPATSPVSPVDTPDVVTAPTDIVAADTQQITTDEEIQADVDARLTPTPKTGLGEDTRSVAQDTQTLNTTQQTIQTAQNTQRAQTTAQAAATPISTTDAPVNKVQPILAQEDAIPSTKVNSDITRAAQKNQRTCNHKYSLITRKCNFCGKRRDSHVHNV